MIRCEHSPGASGCCGVWLWAGAGAIVGVVGWEIAAAAPSWNAFLAFFPVLLRSVALTALVPALAFLTGYGTLAHVRARWGLRGRSSAVLSLALGWGLLSLWVWFLAAAGSLLGRNLFGAWTCWLTMGGCVFLWRKQLKEMASALRDGFRSAGAAMASWAGGPERLLFPVAMGALALVLFHLFLAALTPPVVYDVLEYHLPAARQFVETGGLASPEGNAYLKMPQAIEALYAWGILLEGGRFAPKLIHFYLALSTVALLIALLREIGAAVWLRVLAALLFLTHFVSLKMLFDAYVDMGPALFTTAALLCWLRAFRRPNRLHLSLAGVFLGFAFSCKYPVLGVAILPFLIGLIPFVPREALPFSRLRGGRSAAVTGGICLSGLMAGVVYAPWLLRALVYDHAFFPPLTLPWFGPEDADSRAIAACMALYHRPIPLWSIAYVETVFRRLPLVVSPLLFLAPVLLLLLPRVARPVRALSLFVLLGSLFWSTGPHAQDRFLSPLLPAFAALGVLAVQELRGRSLAGGLLAGVLFSGWAGWGVWGLARDARLLESAKTGLGAISGFEFEQRLMGGVTAEFFRAINQSVEDSEDAGVLLLYEARFAAIAPGVRVVGNTVFDRCFLWELLRSENGADGEWVLAELRARGITHLAVNEVELSRLLWTFPAHDAQGDAGYRYAAHRGGAGGVFPALLPYRRYYPPFYYFGSAAQRAETERRLDAFLEKMRAEFPPVWETEAGGAQLWVCAFQKTDGD